jgi:hypothetical protein
MNNLNQNQTFETNSVNDMKSVEKKLNNNLI